MTEQVAKSRLELLFSDASSEDYFFTSVFAEAVGVAINALEEIQQYRALKDNGGWIPCSVRLPEDMQRCLVTARIYCVPDHVDEPDNYIGLEFNTYSKKFGWLNGNEVIAWMPLPEPYIPKADKPTEPEWKSQVMNHFTKGE